VSDQKTCPACETVSPSRGVYKYTYQSCTGRAGCVRADHIPDAGKMVEPHPNRENPAPEIAPAGADVPDGTTDIVKRLRALVRLDKPEYGGPYGGTAARECMRAMTDAAAEIARLRADLSTERHERTRDAVRMMQHQARADRAIAARAALATRVAEKVREEAAKKAARACLVPPDGGSPTEGEVAVADGAAADIRAIELGPIVATALKDSAP
jgi:hypothetical protein